MFTGRRPEPPLLAFCLRIVRTAARIAPSSERRTWGAEWEAEIVHRWRRLQEKRGSSPGEVLGLLRAAVGAFAHALWLRGQEWRYDLVSQDIRYAIRGLLKRPTLTAVVVGTIGLGVGATTAIFSVLNGVILQPLPYEEPDELVAVWERSVSRDLETNVVSGANYVTWLEENTVFEDLASVTWVSGTVTGAGEPERVGLVAANASLWSILGIEAVEGRVYLPEEDYGAAEIRPALLGYAYWQRSFGGDPSVVGRTLTVNGTPVTVVGVLPPGFRLDLPYAFNSTGTQDLWVPQSFGLDEARSARGRWLQVFGRLKEDVPLERAQAEMEALAGRLQMEFPEYMTGWTVNVVPLQRQVVGEARSLLWILFGSVALVLLIACANVANLLLARAAGRAEEVAIRTALGANRLRLIRQLLTESSALALLGGALGALLAFVAVRGLTAMAPDIPRLDEVAVDGTVLAFALGLALLTGFLFGLVPALRASRPDLTASLKEGGRSGRSGPGILRARNALVVAEIALSLVLLVATGLLIRSFANLVETGVGFETDGVLSAELTLPDTDYPEIASSVQFFEELVRRAEAIPGVTSAGAITNLPLSGSQTATSFWADDRPIPEPGESPVADIRWVHRDYHRTMRIPLLAGRFFDERDHADAPLRVVANRALAEQLWPGGDPIGKRISMPWGDTLVAEVIGVAGDVRHNGPSVEPRPKLYWHHQQWQDRRMMTVVLRTDRDPESLVGPLRREVAAMDPALPLFNLRTMNAWMSETLDQRRFTLSALGLFALIALLLASVGVYGVMSYSVSQQTREIGVRIALGASAGAVTLQVVKRGLALAVIAIGVGVVGALAASRLMQGLVFEVSTSDPVTLTLASLFLAAVAAAACYWPARRAGRVDPMEALRAE